MNWDYDNSEWKATKPWWHKPLCILAIVAGAISLAVIVWLLTVMLFVI